MREPKYKSKPIIANKNLGNITKPNANAFGSYISALNTSAQEKLQDFFHDFQAQCLLNRSEKNAMRVDFENALLYYHTQNVPLRAALEYIHPKFLGGFYARSSQCWFALDDAAKIYPISLEHGHMSLFRLAVYLHEDVVPELLQMALHFSIKRFPSFATTLKKGFFWHYLDSTKRRFTIEAESDLPCQPLHVSLSGSQAFRVLYYKNRIAMEFFHVLTDGIGGMAFLKVLTAEYLRLLGKDIQRDESVFDINETPAYEEFENAFAKVPQSTRASGFVDKTAVQMNGKLSETKPCRVLHLKMSAAALKKAAEKYDTTVTVYLLALIFLACKAATDELQGDLSIQVPVNMRRYFPTKTVRNFAMYCGIRLALETIHDVSGLIQSISDQLKQKSSYDNMVDMLTATERLVNRMKYVPLLIKQPVAKMVHGFLGDKIFTTTLSNLGLVKLPIGFSQHIKSMDFVLGTAIINRALCGLLTINETSTLSITKLTVDPSFENKLCDLLGADGIHVDVEGSALYED